MKEEFSTTLSPRVRRFARALGLTAVIYGFLRLTFIGELISSALSNHRRSTSAIGYSSIEPTDEALLDGE